MPTHKALYLLEKHGEFAIRDVETYHPGPGELLVEIKAVSLNPLDWKVQALGLFVTEYPAILGYDAAGVVKEAGEGTEGFAVGDRVLWEGTIFNSSGANFQQYSLIPANITAKLPPNMSFEQGSTIPSVYITSRRGAQLTPFWEEGGRGKYSSQPLLIIGGALVSARQVVIQVAKLSGSIPSSPPLLYGTQLLKSLGATHVIDRNAPLAEAETQGPAYQVLAPGGTFILVLPFAIDRAQVDDSKLQKQLGIAAFKHLPALLKAASSRWPNNVEVLPNGLAGIPEGLERLKANKVSASKLVALPWT
ncbi:GroES-like protein [Irpex lacteus]|nr:GroES-like protein [Irpex lacteus]